jgi:hypothetical protein
MLQVGNQSGGTLLAGAPGLPSSEQSDRDLAKAVGHLERLGITGDLEDGARWMASCIGKSMSALVIILSAITDQYDPFSLEARAVRDGLEPWKGWLTSQIPRDL